MKNKILAIIVVLVSIAGLNASAQFKLGGSLAYATDINGLGLTVNGTYKFNDQWEAAPSFTYFFKKDFITWWSLDANAHYIFNSDSKYAFYGLGGIEILGTSVDFSSLYGGGSTSTTNFGLNVGGGARINFSDKLDGFGELKFVLSNGSYACFNFGVLYAL
jgi:opacity protein-like surface antigen